MDLKLVTVVVENSLSIRIAAVALLFALICMGADKDAECGWLKRAKTRIRFALERFRVQVDVRSGQRCPKCKSDKLKEGASVDLSVFEPISFGMNEGSPIFARELRKTSVECEDCGHKFVRRSWFLALKSFMR